MATSQIPEVGTKTRKETPVEERFLVAGEMQQLFNLVERASETEKNLQFVLATCTKNMNPQSKEFQVSFDTMQTAIKSAAEDAAEARENIAKEIRRAVKEIPVSDLAIIYNIPSVRAFFKEPEPEKKAETLATLDTSTKQEAKK